MLYYASTSTEKTINKQKEGKEEERAKGLKGGRQDRRGKRREGDRTGKDMGRRGREEDRETETREEEKKRK